MGGAEERVDKLGRLKERIQKNYVSLSLILTFFLSLFLSSFYIIGVAVKGNFAVSGGSDAYYNMRIIQYILSTHHQLLFDPLLNYPIGLENPRPPFFHWLAVLLGYGFSPFLGGVYRSTMTMFLLETAIGGAFIIFPTYLLGKEVFNKKVGIIGAILTALSPLTLMKSIASIGLFDIYTALFAILMIYFYLKAVDTFKEVQGKGIMDELRNSFRSNKISLLYALLGGASLAGSMLTWVGTISIALIIAGVGIIQLIINVIRRKSNMGILFSAIIYSEGFLLAFPWYYETGFIDRWIPVFLIWMLLIISAAFLIILKKKSWVLSTGSYILLLIAAVIVIYFKDNSLLQSIISGQHYFIKNKIYDTIAEAQSLPLGEDIMEFDPFMFFASMVGIGILIYKWIKTKEFKITLMLFFSAGIIFISMIASKFLYFGASATGILTAYVLYEAFTRLGWHQTLEKLEGRGLSKSSLKELKLSQITVILMAVFLLIVPATFYAIDSGIPFNNKTQYDRQIYNATPPFLRPQNYTPPYYLGAFGVSLDLPNSPWVRALSWFRNQDAQYPPNERPGFISWWDYGFQTLEQGQHPVMADNFQDGIFPAAQILMAQNESEIIAVMIARIIDYFNQYNDLNNSTFQSIIKQYLGDTALTKIISYEENGPSYIPQIYQNESYYGPYEDIQAGDAKYILIEHYLANTYPLNKLIDTYQALETATGFYMSYIAVDYRLFPFSGVDTGIFYAPAYLGDFQFINVQGEIVPIDFYNITVTDVNGNTYPLQDFPPGDTAVSYNINYKPMFYNSTVYRVFIGYPPSVVGANNSIPGLSSNLKYYYPMQAWGMPNFELAYKTVFWNPYTDYQNHSNAWQPVSLEQGYYYLKNHIGTVDLNPPASSVLPSDVVFVEYYPGAIIQGRITDSSGMPIAGVRVTIDDQYGIPHETVLTNSSGYYKLYAVAGNDTIIVSTGNYDQLFMVGNNVLQTYNISITQAQANRQAFSPGGQPEWIINKNFVINSHSLTGTVYFNLASTNYFIPNTDIPVNATLKFTNSTENYSLVVNTTQNGSYSVTDLPPYSYLISAYVDGKWYDNVANVTISQNSTSKDVPIPYSEINFRFINKFQYNSTNELRIERNGFIEYFNTSSTNQKIFLPTGLFKITAKNGPYQYYTMLNLTNKRNMTLNVTYENFYYLNLSVGGEYKLISATYQNILNDSYSGVMAIRGNKAWSYLPPSIYLITTTATRNGNYYTNISEIELNQSKSISPILSRGSVISGTIYLGNRSVPGVPVQLMGNGIELQFTTGKNGTFSGYVPYGNYYLTTYFTKNSSVYVSNGEYIVNQPFENFTILASQGHKVSGSLNLAVPGVLTAYSGTQELFYEVIAKGLKYDIYLENGTSISQLKYETLGYAYYQNGYNITLNETPVRVEIELISSYNYNYELHLAGPENYTLEVSNGINNVTLIPGSYRLSISGPNILAVSNQSVLNVVSTYNDQLILLPVNVYAGLNVITQGSVEVFKGGNLVGTGKNLTLSPGVYTVYANYFNTANITTIDLTQNSTLEPNLTQAYLVTFNNNIASTTFISQGNNTISTSYSIYLPIGTYNAYSIRPINASYDLYASKNFNVIGNMQIYLNGTMKHLISNVTFSGFNNRSINNGGYVVIQPSNITIPFGTKTEIAYGTYSVYARYGSYSYFGNITINSAVENITLNLSNSYAVAYSTYLNNSEYNNPIYIGSNEKFYIPPSGVIYLPKGKYIFQGQAIYPYYGKLNNYSLNQQVFVSGNTYLTLEFSIVKQIKVTIIPEGGQLVGYPGNKETFPILIMSDSNIPIDFDLTNSSTFNIYPQYLNLTPYSSGTIDATIGVPKGQPSGTYQVGMNIQYLGIYHYITVNFTVPAITKLNVTLSNTSGSIEGNIIYYEMLLKNTGNSKLNINLRILNLEELQKEGINVLINNQTVSNLTLLPGQFNQTNIGLHMIQGFSDLNSTIIIAVSYNNNTSIYYLYPSIPGIEFKEVKAIGSGIQNYSAVVQYSYLGGMISFIIVLIVAIMISVRRRNRA